MIVLVDATNLFLRNYAAVPALDLNGNPVGGVIGTLLSLRKILGLTKNVDRLILAWDGSGGSKKRRAIIEDYKKGRKPVKLNRNFEFELDNPEENQMYQRIRLGQYLNDLPITQIIIDEIEADDIVGLLCLHFAKEKKVVVSNDKDFIQLLDANTIIYNTAKKMFINNKSAYEENKIHPKNFALARAMTGDKSDNIKGVKGVGLKTLVKLFPEFLAEGKLELEDILKIAESKNDEKYKKFLDFQNIIIDNLKVMRLDSALIGYASVNKIIQSLDEKVCLNSTAFRVKLVEDGMKNFSDSFFEPFRILHFKDKER